MKRFRPERASIKSAILPPAEPKTAMNAVK